MDEKAKEITAMQTVDGVPMVKGMRVYLVDDAHLGRYEDIKPARPIEATVLRISDGQERSVLLRRRDGVETRWHPKPHDVETYGLFASKSMAHDLARRKNLDAAFVFRKDIERDQTKLKKFVKLCAGYSR